MEFDDLIRQCRPPLYKHAIEIARISSLVDDAVQEAIIHIWKVHSKDPTRVNGYYYKAGCNIIKSFFKYESYTSTYGKSPGKKRDPLKNPDTTVFSAYPDPDLLTVEEWLGDPHEPKITEEDVEEALPGLTEREQKMVKLRFYDNYTLGEIQKEYGISSSAWTKARMKLEPKLEKFIASN